MKRIIKGFQVFLFLFFLTSVSIFNAALLAPKLLKSLISDNGRETTIDKQLQVLDTVEADSRQKLEEYSSIIKNIATELLSLETQVKEAKKETEEFLNKKISIVRQTRLTISEIIDVLKKKIAIVEEHRKVLKAYQADPTFGEWRLGVKASPNFDDLQKNASRVFINKERLDELEKIKSRVVEDRNRKKVALEIVTKEHEKKKNQREAFTQVLPVDGALAGFSRNQQGQIIDEQLRGLKFRQSVLELGLTRDESNLFLLETKIDIKKKHVEIAEAEYSHVKRSVSIDSSYVERVKEELGKKRQELLKKREILQRDISAVSPILEKLESNLKVVAEQFGVSSSDFYGWWKKDASTLQTVKDWVVLSNIGVLINKRDVSKSQINLIRAYINQENVDFNHEKRLFEILNSWYRILQAKFRLSVSDEEINKEVSKYKTEETQLKDDLVELQEKRDDAVNVLCSLNVEREAIRELRTVLKEQKNKIFAGNMRYYQERLRELVVAEEELSIRSKLTAKLLEVYAKSIAKLGDSIRKVDDIISELTSKGFWMRSVRSIEWRNLKKVVPDIERFVGDLKDAVKRYGSQFKFSDTLESIFGYLKSPYLLILFLLRLIIAVVIFLLLRSYLPDLRDYLLSVEIKAGLFTVLKIFLGVTVGFLGSYLLGIYLWLLMLLGIWLGYVSYLFSILFYLLSIPYMLLIEYRFIQRMIKENRSREHAFIGEKYQKRFIWIISLLFYVSTAVLLFRQAFLIGGDYTSQLPEILLAFNFVFVLMLVALLFAVGKDWILERLFTERTPFGSWVGERARRYYFVFLLSLIAITIMSSPYVGYGKQVFYVLSRLLITAALIPIFSWLHARVKEASSDFFFYYADPSTVKERFHAGKTWYGLFVIFSFLLFVSLGLIIIARIWGQSLDWGNISRWLNYTLYKPGIDEVTGQPIKVTLISLSKIVLYIVAGLTIAYVTNQYVIRRIFDQLLIGSGVQNTILTLSKYVFIVMAFLIGLQSVGLGSMTMKIIVVIGAIGFAIKEPIGDFFSYFIILVQRPVKIGDLVKIEPDIFGVVRHITPRSTIIRHKNSITLVVPNSKIITSTVKNWHHAQTFGAFGDIEITIPFSADPDRVRSIIFEILDEDNNVLRNPVPIIWLEDFVENGFKFVVRGYLSVNKILDQWDIASDVRFEIVRRLRKEGIRIASPTRRLELKLADVKRVAVETKAIIKEESEEEPVSEGEGIKDEKTTLSDEEK